MPSYTAVNHTTKERTKFTCTIVEMEAWQKQNPEWDVLCGTPGMHTGFFKVSSGWRDVLTTIKKNHPRSTIKIPAGR